MCIFFLIIYNKNFNIVCMLFDFGGGYFFGVFVCNICICKMYNFLLRNVILD